MSTVVGALEIQLLADVARLQKDMDTMKRTVDSGMRDIQRMAQGAANALGALGVGLSAAATFAFVKGVVEANAALDDMAEMTGASVESLSALRQVARVSGEDMNNISGAMAKLAKNLAGVDDESKGAGKALAAIGLSVDQLKSMKADEQLLTIAKAMNEFEDGSGKAAVAQGILGKTGAALIPYLKDLAEWGELNATVTAEQAAEAEKLEKSMRTLRETAHLWGEAIINDVVPAVSELTTKMNEAQKAAGGFWSGLALWITTDGAAEANPQKKIAELNATLAGLKKTRDELTNNPTAAKVINNAIFGDVEDIDRQTKALNAQIAYLKQLAQIQAQASINSGNMDARDLKAAQKRQIEYSSIAESATKAAKATKEADKWRLTDSEQSTLSVVDRNMFAATGTTFELSEARDKEELRQREEHRKAVEAIVAQTESGKLELQRKSMIEAAAMFQEGALTEVQWLEYAAEQNKRFTEKTRDEFGELEQAINGWARSSADAIVDFVSGTKTNFGDMVDSILKDIARLTVNEYLTKPLFSGLTASMKGSSGGGGFGDLFGGLGKLLGLGGSGYGDVAGVAAGVPQYAVGTDYVPRDGLAMIHRGERIVPAAQNTPESRQNITVNVNVPAGSPAETRRAAGQGAREALAALSGARRYG